MKHATQRLLSLAIAIALFLGALFAFFNLVQPAYQSSQLVKAQKISKENFLKNQQETIKQVKTVVDAYKGNGNLQNLTALALPPSRDEANLVNQINVLATKHGIAIQNLTISAPTARSVTSKTKATASSSLVRPIGVLTIQVRATASYANFRQFLESVENNIRVTDVNGLTVTPLGRPNQDYYGYDLALATYYQNP